MFRLVLPFVLSCVVDVTSGSGVGVGGIRKAGSTKHGGKSHPDYVASLPGMKEPLPSPWYSGYLTYTLEGVTIHTHYILVEAETTAENQDLGHVEDGDGRKHHKEDDNDNDDGGKPLIYWSNGGPGASSMYGLMTELGPLLFSKLSMQTDEYRKTGIPTPLYNEYSWSRLGSLLLFDAPAPVGFSFCEKGTEGDDKEQTNVLEDDGNNDNPDGKKGYGYSCLSWTDELASLNTYSALQAFYEKFPAYSAKPLFLTGESYGGIYIPNLAKRIVEGDNGLLRHNLKGFAVGDGCVGTDTKICAPLFAENIFFNTLFLAGHHQLPLNTFHEILEKCGGAEGTAIDTEECQSIVQTAKTQSGGFYEYALYDDCTYENGLLESTTRRPHHRSDLPQFPVNGGLNDYPCGGGDVMGYYLNSTAVMEALHVQGPFYITDDAEGFDYTSTEPSVENFYKSVNGNLKVLVYNGDADPRINSFDAQNWTSHLGFDIVEDWTPWTIDGCRRMGGYVTRYEGGFDFLTIRGAGHMVPTYKPAASFAFLKAWIEGTDYPSFDEDCEVPPSRHMHVDMSSNSQAVVEEQD